MLWQENFFFAKNEKLCWIVFYIKMYFFFNFPSTTVVLLNILVYIVCSIVYTMKFYYAVSCVCGFLPFFLLLLDWYVYIVPNVYDMCEQLIRVKSISVCASVMLMVCCCKCVRMLFFEAIRLVAMSDDISLAWRTTKSTIQMSYWRFVDISKKGMRQTRYCWWQYFQQW